VHVLRIPSFGSSLSSIFPTFEIFVGMRPQFSAPTKSKVVV
jgi:hypothetical protein